MDAEMTPMLTHKKPSLPRSLKRKRCDNPVDDLRQFQRVRIYTSPWTEALFILPCLYAYVCVYKMGENTEYQGSGQCCLFKDENEVGFLGVVNSVVLH